MSNGSAQGPSRSPGPPPSPTAVPGAAEPALPGWLFGALFALVLLFQLVAIRQQSLSGDGAYHLLAGHQALRYGQNLLNLEHPPLAKLVMALPTLFFEEPLAEPVAVERALERSEGLFRRPRLLHRATLLGRGMVLAVFVLPFLYACWRLGRRWGGPEAGKILVVLLGLSFSVLPNLATLQTDSAVSLGFVLVLLAAARYVEERSLVRALLLGLALGFAMAVKFSGVLLVPTVLLAWWMGERRSPQKLAAAARLAGLALVAYLAVDAVYLVANRSYDPAAGRATIATYAEGRGTLVVHDQLAPYEDALLEVESVQPRLAQWLTGFQGIRIQNRLGVYPAYSFGKIRYQGSWWYFPVLFLVKTPFAILFPVLIAVGLALRRGGPVGFALPGSVLLVYGLAAMTSNYNLGVRHLMPVMPLLYLPAARLLATRRRWALGVLGALALEATLLAPLWMCQTNSWMLGAANPTRFSLGAGNLEYRQNFIQLARAARERGIEGLNVVFPPLAPPAVTAYLPDAHLLQAGDPLRPGWYAVNVRVEQYIPAIERSEVPAPLVELAERWRPVWEAVRRGEDHGYVAGTFHLYHLGPEPDSELDPPID